MMDSRPHSSKPARLVPPADIDERATSIEADHRETRERCRAAEQRIRELTDVATSALRLHDVTAHHEVLLTIETLFSNLLGAHDLAVCEVTPSGLKPLTTLGAAVKLGPGTLDRGPIARLAAGGVTYLAGAAAPRLLGAHPDLELAAAVPLRVGGTVVAVVLALRFVGADTTLPDRTLLELAAHHAALALWNASLRSAPSSSSRTTRRGP
jgi:hypothetical protein